MASEARGKSRDEVAALDGGSPPLPATMVIETLSGRDELLHVGPSLRGSIYASKFRPYCYRILRRHEAPLRLRDAIGAAIQQPRRRGFAPIVDAGFQPSREGPEDFYVVRYEILRAATLAETLMHGDSSLRIRRVAAVAAALQGWWQHLGHSSGLTPADVAFDYSDIPHLLSLPSAKTPEIRALLEQPTRSWFLPPEIIRGREQLLSEQSDRYALGTCLLLCVCRVAPATDGPEALLRAATGLSLAREQLSPAVPFWLEKLPVMRWTIDAARRLSAKDLGHRAGEDLSEISRRLIQWADLMEPHTAVAELRKAGKPTEALDLINDILLERNDPKLLVMAGDIAKTSADHVLDAIDYYERAIACDPNATSAYQGQFEAIAMFLMAGSLGAWLMSLGGQNLSGAKLDAMLPRDFGRLAPKAQREHEELVARYWLERERWQEASLFIYPRIFGDAKWHWWKFGMNLAYGETLIGQGRLDDAKIHLDQLKATFPQARRSGAISEAEIHEHGSALAELELAVFRRRHGEGGGQPS